MNKKMRDAHFEEISNEAARNAYNTLVAACESRDGGMTDADQMLIGDYARAEQVKQMALQDIGLRGLGRERHNGSQTYYADNKSIGVFRSFVEQQRKLLAELKLTPGSRKASTVQVDDDFADF